MKEIMSKICGVKRRMGKFELEAEVFSSAFDILIQSIVKRRKYNKHPKNYTKKILEALEGGAQEWDTPNSSFNILPISPLTSSDVISSTSA